MTFEDVFIHFTREEWDLLTESQKRLYLKTMVNNFSLVMSVGLESSRYRLISPPEPESAPEVPARIGIAAAVAEVSQESPSLAGAQSLESKLRHAVDVGKAGWEFLWFTAGHLAVTDGLRKPRFSWPNLGLHPPANC